MTQANTTQAPETKQVVAVYRAYYTQVVEITLTVPADWSEGEIFEALDELRMEAGDTASRDEAEYQGATGYISSGAVIYENDELETLTNDGKAQRV